MTSSKGRDSRDTSWKKTARQPSSWRKTTLTRRRLHERAEGYVVQKGAPMTKNSTDPFEKYRGMADTEETMPERMRRVRGEYPRETHNTTPNESGESVGNQ